MTIDDYRNTIIQGNVLDKLKELPSDSVDMCITSPPYWNLRDYGFELAIWDEDPTCHHVWSPINNKCFDCTAWKGQLGHESSYQLFIKHLVDIFTETARVLKPTGTLWINIGDTYASTPKGNKEPSGLQSKNYGIGENVPMKRNVSYGKVQQKSLIGIPDRLKIALIDAGLICRNEVIWHKPNAMPSSAKDRFTNDSEKLYFFTKNKKYYFEQQFEPHSEESIRDYFARSNMSFYDDKNPTSKYIGQELDGNKEGRTRTEFMGDLSKGRNMRTTWRQSKYENNEQEASVRQGMNKDRGNNIVRKRDLPPQALFVSMIREWILEGNEKTSLTQAIEELATLTEIPLSTVQHWFRKDESGFAYPTIEDWKKVEIVYKTKAIGYDFSFLINYKEEYDTISQDDKGRNMRTTWVVNPASLVEVRTKAMPEAHFAVFPEELIESPIKSGSPLAVCVTCDKPKIIDYTEERIATRPGNNVLQGKSGTDKNPNFSLHNSDLSKYREQIIRKDFKYIKQCEHDTFKPGIVMDIFMGSGTTGIVAKRLNRDYIGIEINPEYIEIAEKRIGKSKLKATLPDGYKVKDVRRGL